MEGHTAEQLAQNEPNILSENAIDINEFWEQSYDKASTNLGNK